MTPAALLLASALDAAADPPMAPAALFIVGALVASVLWMFVTIWLLDRERGVWRRAMHEFTRRRS